MKNSKNRNNTVETVGTFMLECAISHLQNVGISSNGLLEVILKSGNPELAIKVLAGKYKTPNLPKQVSLKETVCTMVSYDPWLNEVSYSYERNKTKHIYVNSEYLESYDLVVTHENYKELEVNWSSCKNPKGITITFPEMETMTDFCCLATWMEAEMIVPAEKEFTRNIENIYTEDIF